MRTRFLAAVLIAALHLVPAAVMADEEKLDSRDLRDVLVLGGYGAAAGAGAGMVLWPLTGRPSSLVTGAGTGFILGVLVGVYHVTHRDDPTNPFSGALAGMDVQLPRSGQAGRPVSIQLSWRF